MVERVELTSKLQNQFTNWGETVKQNYEQILYPVPLAYRTTPSERDLEQETIQIQELVKRARSQGKGVRASGIRHSWSKIFGDDGNYLVSLYPPEIANGNTRANVIEFAKRLKGTVRETNRKSLCSITKVSTTVQGTTLVRVGAGVSSEQLRVWCVENNLQIPSNTIIVELSFCGALSTASHGSGIGTQTLCDYVHAIEFVNCQGNIQTVSKDDQSSGTKELELVRAAASALGLMGVVVFVTLEMKTMQIAHITPFRARTEDVIPLPNVTSGPELERFKRSVNRTYSEWFYFPR